VGFGLGFGTKVSVGAAIFNPMGFFSFGFAAAGGFVAAVSEAVFWLT